MAAIKFDTFFGEAPAYNPRKLPAHFAQVAYNLKLWSGALAPMRGIASVAATHVANPATIFKYSDTVLLEFASKSHVVRAPIVNDTYGRVLITDGVYPKVTDATRVAPGAAPYPNSTLRLGVPAPATNISASVSGTATNPTTDLAETRYYVETFVNSYGEEGPPSPASNGIDIKPGQTGVLALAAVPSGAYDFVTKRLYRSNGGAFQWLDDVAYTATSYNDTKTNDQLGEVLATTDWDPPPDDMIGIINVAGAFCAGFRKNELLCSEPGAPHAWPYSYPVDATILGLVAVGNNIVVVTDGQLYIFTGVHPGSLAPMKPEGDYAGVSAESILDLGYGAAYASADGLVFVGGDSNPMLVTQGVFSYDAWKAIVPSTIKAARWKGLYVAFYNDGDGDYAFLFNPKQPDAGIVYVEAAPVYGRYTDGEDGDLYLVVQNAVCKWDAGATTTYIWRSHKSEQPRPVMLKAVQIVAEAYPVSVAVYADGELQDRVDIKDGAPRRLRNAVRARSFEIEVIGSSEVVSVAAATTIEELKAL